MKDSQLYFSSPYPMNSIVTIKKLEAGEVQNVV